MVLEMNPDSELFPRFLISFIHPIMSSIPCSSQLLNGGMRCKLQRGGLPVVAGTRGQEGRKFPYSKVKCLPITQELKDWPDHGWWRSGCTEENVQATFSQHSSSYFPESSLYHYIYTLRSYMYSSCVSIQETFAFTFFLSLSSLLRTPPLPSVRLKKEVGEKGKRGKPLGNYLAPPFISIGRRARRERKGKQVAQKD